MPSSARAACTSCSLRARLNSSSGTPRYTTLTLLAGISLATRPNRACYIPVGHSGADLYSDAPSQLPMALALEKLKPLLEDPAVLKVGHNFKYDWVMFAKAGIDVAPVDDTMILSFDLDAGLHGHGMDELARLHFDHACISFKQVCGTGRSQVTFDVDFRIGEHDEFRLVF